MKGKADILVMGNVEASVDQVVSDQFVFARASGKIQAIATESGKILATFEPILKVLAATPRMDMLGGMPSRDVNRCCQ